jgi:hypothetical protein
MISHESPSTVEVFMHLVTWHNDYITTRGIRNLRSVLLYQNTAVPYSH